MSIFNALTANLWAIEPNALRNLAAIALRQPLTLDIEALQPRAGAPLQNTRTVQMREGVAIVPVTGPLFPKASLMETNCGAISMETLAQDINAALDHPNVNAIILDIDSPGGLINGTSEMAAFIKSASEYKPIIAYSSGTIASAAYWLASGCSEIVLEKAARAGSIGVVTARGIQKEANQAGEMIVEIVSSNATNKRPDASTEEGIATIRAELDDIEACFIGDVAANRGITTQQVIESFGNGGMKIAADAVKVGMADRVGSFEDVLSELQNRFPKQNRSTTMTRPQNTNAAAVSIESLRVDHPELVATLQAEGAAAERQRILALDSIMLAGHETAINAAKADGKSTAAEVSLQIVQAQRKAGTAYIDNVAAGLAANPTIHPSGTAAGSGASAPTEAERLAKMKPEERLQATWDKDEALQKEFGGNFAEYAAYEKGVAAGRIRVTKAK